MAVFFWINKMTNGGEFRAIFVRMYALLCRMEAAAVKKYFEKLRVLEVEFSKYYELAVKLSPEGTQPGDDPLLHHFDIARNSFRQSFQDASGEIEGLRKIGRLDIIKLHEEFAKRSLEDGKRYRQEIKSMLRGVS